MEIFRIQKRVICIITKSNSRASCRQLFKQLEILPLQSQYIFSTLLFVIKNKNLFATNQNFQTINTRYNSDLHLPTCNLTLYQKGAYFSGIKLFNHLPQTLKCLSVDIKAFKLSLLRFLKPLFLLSRRVSSAQNWLKVKEDVIRLLVYCLVNDVLFFKCNFSILILFHDFHVLVLYSFLRMYFTYTALLMLPKWLFYKVNFLAY